MIFTQTSQVVWLNGLSVRFTAYQQNIRFDFELWSKRTSDAVRFGTRAPALTEQAFGRLISQVCSGPGRLLHARESVKQALKEHLCSKLRKLEADALPPPTPRAPRAVSVPSAGRQRGKPPAEAPPASQLEGDEIFVAGEKFFLDVLGTAVVLRHPSFDGVSGCAARCRLTHGYRLEPYMVAGIRRGLELEGSMAKAGTGGRSGKPDFDATTATLQRVVAGYGLACGADRTDLSSVWWRPWFLNATHEELAAVDLSSLMDVGGVESILHNPTVLNSFMCAVGQSILGTSEAEAMETLRGAGAISFSSRLRTHMSKAKLDPPRVHEALKVMLLGGEAAEHHSFGVLASTAFALLALDIDACAARSSGLLNSAAAASYGSSNSTAAPKLQRPDGWAVCKAPRRECLGRMPASYLDASYTIGGDYELGCALGACLQDLWPGMLDAHLPCLDGTSAEGSDGLASTVRAALSASGTHYGLSKNNYNELVSEELGSSAYAGTHLVDNSHWHRKTIAMARFPKNSHVNVFDLVPFFDPDQRRGMGAPTDDARAVCKHFGVGEQEMLRRLASANQLVRRSLPADASVAKVSDGRIWIAASSQAFSSPSKAAGKSRSGGSSIGDVSAEEGLAVTRVGPFICTGVGYVIKGYSVGGKLTYNNVGKINTLEITYKARTSSQQVVSQQIKHHAGGGRQSQASSVRVPSGEVRPCDRGRGGGGQASRRAALISEKDMVALYSEQHRARQLLKRGDLKSHRGVILLRDSFKRDSDKEMVDEIASRNGMDQTFHRR